MILFLATFAFAEWAGATYTVTFKVADDKGTVDLPDVSFAPEDSIVKEGVIFKTPSGILGNGKSYRIKGYGSFAISSAVGNVKKIELTSYSSTYKLDGIETNVKTYKTTSSNNTTAKWTGTATSVDFKLTGRAIWLKSIVVTIDAKKSTSMSFDKESVSVDEIKSYELPTLTLNANDTELTGKTIIYSSSNTDVASVNESTGDIELLNYGKTTITASFVGDEEYESSSASYTLIYLPSDVVMIDENKENNIAVKDNAVVSLMRTLSSEYWNTFCVPFGLSLTQVEKTFGGGTVIAEFSGNVTDGVMAFNRVTDIKAGVPYIIKPVNTTVNPIIVGVNISDTKPKSISSSNGYSFTGVYSPTDIRTADNGKNLFVTTTGIVKTPASNSSDLKGMRAYITIPVAQDAKTVCLNLDGVTTGIDRMAVIGNNDVSVFNLSGQRMSRKCDLSKGLYIQRGKKIIVK